MWGLRGMQGLRLRTRSRWMAVARLRGYEIDHQPMLRRRHEHALEGDRDAPERSTHDVDLQAAGARGDAHDPGVFRFKRYDVCEPFGREGRRCKLAFQHRLEVDVVEPLLREAHQASEARRRQEQAARAKELSADVEAP